MRNYQLIVSLTLAVLAGPAYSGDLTITHRFTAGQLAKAGEVNANFSAAKTAVDDNQSQITELKVLVSALMDRVTALEADLTMVKTNSVLALDGQLVKTTHNGKDVARFTGVNVQVINGVDQATINGLGNLIVGFDLPASAGSDKTGSHNLVVGPEHSYTDQGGLVAGRRNTISGPQSSVSGGEFNTASGKFSSVTGGRDNTAEGEGSSVSGGTGNLASGLRSSVSGGWGNKAEGAQGSSVSGGFLNIASGAFSTVSGGHENIARGDSSSVSGGRSNTASGVWSTVSGGNSLTATLNFQHLP